MEPVTTAYEGITYTGSYTVKGRVMLVAFGLQERRISIYGYESALPVLAAKTLRSLVQRSLEGPSIAPLPTPGWGDISDDVLGRPRR